MQGEKHIVINTNSNHYKKWLLKISVTELAENGSSHFILRKFLHGNYHGRDFEITFYFYILILFFVNLEINFPTLQVHNCRVCLL